MRFVPVSFVIVFSILLPLPLRGEDDFVLTHRLDNGLTILVVQRSNVPVAHCRIAYRVGAASDPAGREGLSDLLGRLTFHGTRQLGTKDADKEEILRKTIERTIQSRDLLLKRLPEETIHKMKSLPREIRTAEEMIQTKLKTLSGAKLPPMSREEMDDLIAFVREQEEQIHRLRDEIEKIKSSPLYHSFDTVRILDIELEKFTRQLAALLVPDPLRTTYRDWGAIALGSRTSRDATIFAAMLPANRIELFFWVESKRMTDAVFRYFSREKAFALDDAVDRAERAPSFVQTVRTITFPDHPYGGPLRGTPETIARIDEKSAREHYRATYSPDRTTIVIVGAVDPDMAFYLAERYFGRAQARSPGALPETPPPAGPFTLYRLGSTGSVELRYILPGTSHSDWNGLECFISILRLHPSISADLLSSGKAVSTEIGIERGVLGSVLTIRATLGGGVLPDTFSLHLQDAVKRIATSKFSVGIFERARSAWKACVLDGLEETGVFADTLALASARGNWRTVLPDALDGLTQDGVEKASRAHFEHARPIEVLTEEVK